MHAELAAPGSPARARPPAGPAVRVEAPARLHLGFLDPSATLGRRFGSIGLVVEGLDTVVELAPAPEDRFDAADGAAADLVRARAHVQALRRATGCAAGVHLRLARTLPAHAGLGSGTQLALAVGHAFSAAFDLGLDSATLARLLGRGTRSGVGIAGFDVGGLLLDGGPHADGTPAALVARHPLPPAWRVILVLDPRVQGLCGAAEKAALATLPPLPREAAADICHEVLMRLLPGAAGAEFAPFAAGVTRVQRLLARHFAPAQGGPFASPAVGRVVEFIAAHACAGIGQSSWGPTGFAIVATLDEARRALGSAQAAGVVDPALELRVASARNRGGTIVAPPAPRRAGAATPGSGFDPE
jgi:beta-RFAP synthase